MRNLFLSVAALSVLFYSSCAEKEAKRIDMKQVAQFEDSIPHIIPGARSIHTLQKDDATEFKLIVGSPSFYTASDDNKQSAAIRTGLMVLHVLGPDNSIKNATLVLTKKDNDNQENRIPEDGISLDMKIDSLKKVLYPAK